MLHGVLKGFLETQYFPGIFLVHFVLHNTFLVSFQRYILFLKLLKVTGSRGKFVWLVLLKILSKGVKYFPFACHRFVIQLASMEEVDGARGLYSVGPYFCVHNLESDVFFGPVYRWNIGCPAKSIQESDIYIYLYLLYIEEEQATFFGGPISIQWEFSISPSSVSFELSISHFAGHGRSMLGEGPIRVQGWSCQKSLPPVLNRKRHCNLGNC